MHTEPEKIFEAIDRVRDQYREGSADEQLARAVDQLIECTRAYFREQETAQLQAGRSEGGVHLEAHRRILEYLVTLRRNMADFERVHFLPQLRFVDYWLTTHIVQEKVQFH